MVGSTSSTLNAVITDEPNTITVAEKECEECGESFARPKSLEMMTLCPDCRPEWDGFNPRALKTFPGSSLPEKPLMEYGPKSKDVWEDD